MKLIKAVIIAGAAGMLLPSCRDVMGSMYDEPQATAEYGFVKKCTSTEAGTIYIDASSYTTWTYIDFPSASIDTRDVEQDAPEQWSFAVHRYDTKTHDATVLATPLTDISAARSWQAPAGDKGVADVWTTDVIVTDMSAMMDGYLCYIASWYNPELSSWLDVDTSTMPPIYTLSGRVYIINLTDGSRAAVRLTDFMNDAGIKGFMTIEYIYPL